MVSNRSRLQRYLDCGAVFAEDLGDLQRIREVYTVNGNPGIVSSPYGNAMSFVSENIDCGYSSVYNFGSGDFTLLAMIKTVKNDSDYQTVMMKGAVGGGGKRYVLFIRNGNVRIDIDDDTTDKSKAGTVAVADGLWNLVAGVRSGNDLLVYAKGIVDGSSTDITGYGDIDSVAKPFAIGESSNDLSSDPFVGSIKYAISFPRALSPTEISNIALGKVW